MTTSTVSAAERAQPRSLFTGKEHDAESELDYFGARYYESQTGRWLLPDWSAVPVPVPYAVTAWNPTNPDPHPSPQSLVPSPWSPVPNA